MANPRRRPEARTIHNIEVVRLAKEYEEKGYDVFADVPLPGYEKPAQIGSSIPDIIAVKHRKKANGEFEVADVVIVEVETEDSRNGTRALQQERDFRDYADQPRPYRVRVRIVIAT